MPRARPTSRQLGRHVQPGRVQLDPDAAGHRDVLQVGDQPVADVHHRGRAELGRPRDPARTAARGGGARPPPRPASGTRARARPARPRPSPAGPRTPPRRPAAPRSGSPAPGRRRSPSAVTASTSTSARTTSPPTTRAPSGSASARIPSASRSSQSTGVSGGTASPSSSPVGDGAHRRDVGEVLRGGLVADVLGRGPVPAEVPGVDQQVGRGDDAPVRGREHRGVVARARAPADRRPRRRTARSAGRRARTRPPLRQ